MSDAVGVAVNQKNGYDFPRLNSGLGNLGYALEYFEETGSTMDDAKMFGSQPTVVLAGHQTAGRGRYGRSWQDEAGNSVIMTVVEPFNEATGDPAVDSILPSQVFVTEACVALQAVAETSDIQLKWLNDIVACSKTCVGVGKKLGGILVENTLYKGPDKTYPKLFGIGINVNYPSADTSFPATDYGAISLREVAPVSTFDLTDIVLAIIKQWQAGRNDLRAIEHNINVFNYHDARWQDNAALIGRLVQISGFGIDKDQVAVGEVVATPLNRGLVIVDGSGAKREIQNQEYHSTTIVKVLEAA